MQDADEYREARTRKHWMFGIETYWKTWSLGISVSLDDVHIAVGPWVLGFVHVVG